MRISHLKLGKPELNEERPPHTSHSEASSGGVESLQLLSHDVHTDTETGTARSGVHD